LSEKEFERLKALDAQGRSHRIQQLLDLPPLDLGKHKSEFHHRFITLALEALRRDKISRAKFLELAERIGVDRLHAETLIETAGIDEEETEPVLLPED
jgi:hypothetical protein